MPVVRNVVLQTVSGVAGVGHFSPEGQAIKPAQSANNPVNQFGQFDHFTQFDQSVSHSINQPDIPTPISIYSAGKGDTQSEAVRRQEGREADLSVHDINSRSVLVGSVHEGDPDHHPPTRCQGYQCL